MATTTSEARRERVSLIERVNLDRTEVEAISKRGSAVLMSKDLSASWWGGGGCGV